jgi:hypothetical protein
VPGSHSPRGPPQAKRFAREALGAFEFAAPRDEFRAHQTPLDSRRDVTAAGELLALLRQVSRLVVAALAIDRFCEPAFDR